MNYILVTVDVEGPKGEGYDSDDPVRNFIWGRDDEGNAFGIDMIMDLLESFDVKGLFFVDIAEAWDYGKKQISEVIKHIRNRGHMTGVHLHPNHMRDEDRHFLYEYTKEEQYEMISECTALYREITGEAPQFFRAGKYGANYDTLDILDSLGYQYDFSEFFGQKWCGIHPPLTADLPCRYKGLTEIPVTVFYSADLFGMKRIDKLDLEMACFAHRYVTDSLMHADGNIIVLFLHSFSFTDWRKSPDCPRFKKPKYDSVSRNLRYTFMNPNACPLNPYETEKLIQSGRLKMGPDNRCRTALKNPLLAYFYILCTAFRVKETSRKAAAFVLANVTAVIIVLARCLKQR